MPHNHKKPSLFVRDGGGGEHASTSRPRFHYTFRALLILESKTYANEPAAWFYKARNFDAAYRRHLAEFRGKPRQRRRWRRQGTLKHIDGGGGREVGEGVVFTTHHLRWRRCQPHTYTIQDLYSVYTMKKYQIHFSYHSSWRLAMVGWHGCDSAWLHTMLNHWQCRVRRICYFLLKDKCVVSEPLVC